MIMMQRSKLWKVSTLNLKENKETLLHFKNKNTEIRNLRTMEIILTTSSGNMKERKKAFIIKYFNNKAGERERTKQFIKQ